VGSTNGSSTEDDISQVSLSAPSKKTTAQNKSNNAAVKGLEELSVSLKGLTKSSKKVAQLNADIATGQIRSANTHNL